MSLMTMNKLFQLFMVVVILPLLVISYVWGDHYLKNKNPTLERKPESRNLKQEVYPRSENIDKNSPHMSPPRMTHKIYCIEGSAFALIYVYFGWDEQTGTYKQVNTFMQPLSSMNIQCR